MSGDANTPGLPPWTLRSLLRGDGRAMAGVAAVTVAGQLALFLLPQAFGVSARAAMLAALTASGVWAALAAPILAAGPARGISALLRGGIVADATAVLLVVLWLSRPEVSFLSAVKLYCIYAAVALCGVAGARCAETQAGRYTAAVIAAVILLTLQAGPFWLSGALQGVPQAHKTAAAGVALRLNPLYGVFSVVAERAGFVWHLAPVMYRITRLGEDIPVPPVWWYEPAGIYLFGAGILSATHLVKRRRR